jgi:cation diffusion facilitator CzcD-associated flavoprotein CzcO
MQPGFRFHDVKDGARLPGQRVGAHIRGRPACPLALPRHRDGPLSAPTMPAIPGVKDFRGEAYHTGTWPHEKVRFEGKRMAVIGTGATGVQAITENAKTVGGGLQLFILAITSAPKRSIRATQSWVVLPPRRSATWPTPSDDRAAASAAMSGEVPVKKRRAEPSAVW